ncbi:MAG: ferrochelatase [Acidobacteriaceae bacterium]
MSADTANAAILLLAHGTPNALGEMADYLKLVTNGRILPHEVVEELQHRYAEIGLSETPGDIPPPLTRWTLAQRDLLQTHLAAAGTPIPVYAAMRNWHPLIADVVARIRADGITHLTALCLAPQNSRTSIGLYKRALTSALAASAPDGAPDPIALTFVDAWSEEPHLIAAFAQRLAEAYGHALAETGTALPILFTAHSVPCRTIMVSDPNAPANPTPGGRPAPPPQTTPDPYPVEAKRTAALVFEAAFANSSTPPPPNWFFAFQSQGVAGGPWIGPTEQDTLTAIAAQGFPGVILQPIGFLADHVEILYDIDIDFQHTARDLNLRLFRPQSLNDSPLLTQSLANVLQPHIASAASSSPPNAVAL